RGGGRSLPAQYGAEVSALRQWIFSTEGMEPPQDSIDPAGFSIQRQHLCPALPQLRTQARRVECGGDASHGLSPIRERILPGARPRGLEVAAGGPVLASASLSHLGKFLQ